MQEIILTRIRFVRCPALLYQVQKDRLWNSLISLVFSEFEDLSEYANVCSLCCRPLQLAVARSVFAVWVLTVSSRRVVETSPIFFGRARAGALRVPVIILGSWCRSGVSWFVNFIIYHLALYLICNNNKNKSLLKIQYIFEKLDKWQSSSKIILCDLLNYL